MFFSRICMIQVELVILPRSIISENPPEQQNQQPPPPPPPQNQDSSEDQDEKEEEDEEVHWTLTYSWVSQTVAKEICA